MLEDAGRALAQMLSPPLRAVLWKSIGLALALIVVVALLLNRLIMWLLGAGSAAVETGLGPHAHTPATVLGVVAFDRRRIGHRCRQRVFDAGRHRLCRQFLCRRDRRRGRARALSRPIRPGVAFPLWLRFSRASGRRCWRSSSIFARAVSAVCGLRRRDFLSGDGLALGREYFDLAAMRFRSPDEAKAFRKHNARHSLSSPAC